ncbi:MAG: hypothetical protein IPG24_27225 [Leptospiraceae bacterium]|nr:hypothetical protein [Leptospiraceae bacterium]
MEEELLFSKYKLIPVSSDTITDSDKGVKFFFRPAQRIHRKQNNKNKD